MILNKTGRTDLRSERADRRKAAKEGGVSERRRGCREQKEFATKSLGSSPVVSKRPCISRAFFVLKLQQTVVLQIDDSLISRAAEVQCKVSLAFNVGTVNQHIYA